ncbi:unnamed protein product [Rhizoctonia solani]|uniref:Uncharacterized protein n=1 Tax=Rhizoctonia solani TaxID=456999 RepID=A0A8H3DXF2_9AGAM|nr:unnamed protein product [Rhizoctonia solani]
MTSWAEACEVLVYFPDLQDFQLGHNQLEHLHPSSRISTSEALPNLTTLNLDSNILSDWVANMVSCSLIPQLRNLIMPSNAITTIPRRVDTQTTKEPTLAVHYLAIPGNPISNWSSVDSLVTWFPELRELSISLEPLAAGKPHKTRETCDDDRVPSTYFRCLICYITQVEDNGEEILDLTNSDPPEEPASKPAKAVKEKPAAVVGRPISRVTKARLPNGNYACHHKCKDKTACRHMCCREGLPKPPPSPKNAKPKPTDDFHPKPKNTVEKQKSHLDYLHNKANNGRDSLIRTRDTQPSVKATVRCMDSSLSSPVKIPTLKPKEGSPSSDQDLPEPSVIRIKRQASLNSGSTNYDDSDMDQWAANLPSELLECDVETPALPGKDRSHSGSPSAIPAIVKNNKRSLSKGNEYFEHKSKRPRTEFSTSVDELPLAQDTPICKRPPTEILPTPQSSSIRPIEQPKPLFRPSSSVGRSSPRTSNHSENKPETPPREDAFEDFMDYMFEGVKIITGSASEDASTTVKAHNTLEHNPANQLQTERKYVSNRSPLKAVRQPIKMTQEERKVSGSGEYDPIGDFNNWLDENGL